MDPVVTRKSACDRRNYRTLNLPNGLRAVVVQDQEAIFAAGCVNVQAGYFDDPPDLMGLSHFLEHACHLGSEKYPEEGTYKKWLAEHGGASNASTGTIHTQFYFTVYLFFLYERSSSLFGNWLHLTVTGTLTGE
jgi:secreted Zn-dependent insulinase-like peptidase